MGISALGGWAQGVRKARESADGEAESRHGVLVAQNCRLCVSSSTKMGANVTLPVLHKKPVVAACLPGEMPSLCIRTPHLLRSFTVLTPITEIGANLWYQHCQPVHKPSDPKLKI